MTSQDINRELVIIQKSFEYIIDNLLSTENVEIPFPDHQKYQLKKVIGNCKELSSNGFYKKAYEQLLFTVGYLFSHFEIVKKRVLKDYESMLKIIDIKTIRIKELENEIQDDRDGLRPREEELNFIKEQIQENLQKLEHVEDIFNFSRDRIDEFSEFVNNLDKRKLDPDKVKSVLLKELNLVQNLIITKYESKFQKNKEKPTKRYDTASRVKKAVKEEESKLPNEVNSKVEDDLEEESDDDSDLITTEETEEKIDGKKFLRRGRNG